MDSDLNDADSLMNAQPENVFSSIVTAISGARQTANQEFNRFWDKLTNTTPNSTRTHLLNNQHQKPRNQMFRSTLFGNEGDLARIEAGKIIHGRLVPDNNRGVSHIKNADIQTDEFVDNKNFSIKRKSSLKEDSTPQRPKKISRKEYSTPVASTSFKESPKTPLLTQQSLHAQSLSPVETKPIPAAREESFRDVSHSEYKPYGNSPGRTSPVRTSPVRASSVRASPMRASPVRANSPVISSPVKSSPFKKSPYRTSPMRSPSENQIKTGSVKSVRRLTFELEEAFSPRFPLPVGYTKQQNTNSDSSDPFHSTPLLKSNAIDNNLPKSSLTPTRENSFNRVKFTSPTERHLTDTVKVATSTTLLNETNVAIDHQSISNVSQDAPSTSKRFDQEEEDRRIEELERNVSTIKSQMHNYVSHPSLRSPTPSHTITTDIVNNTTISYKHNYSVPRGEGKSLSPIKSSSLESSSPRKSPAIRTSTTPDQVTGRSSPLKASTSASLSSPVITSKYQSPYNSPTRLPNDNAPPLAPPAPPAPPPPFNVTGASETFSPVRDIPNAFLKKRFLSPTKYPTPKSIKESQLAPFLGPNIAINEKTPLKPTDKHKSTMRELIQLIPGVKLRKTDRILGPDGRERPNPFWNEIYNRGGRKLY